MLEADTTSGSQLTGPLLWGAGLVVVDQLSKLAASRNTCGELICPLHNEALFLGLGAGSGVSVVATGTVGLALFVAWVRAARRRGAVPMLAIASVFAGIIANAIDRVTLGFVRDFLAIPGGVVINVADVAVVVGLLVCVASVTHSILHSPSISERG